MEPHSLVTETPDLVWLKWFTGDRLSQAVASTTRREFFSSGQAL